MSRFNAKFLTFYGVSLITAVFLFNRVAVYGEGSLKASPSLDGVYLLKTKNLPPCFQGDNVVLRVQQSGVYLRGQLLPQSLDTNLEEQGDEVFPLDGKWTNETVNLAGILGKFDKCQNESITLKASFQENQLIGQFKLNSLPQEIIFTAQKQQPETNPKTSH